MSHTVIVCNEKGVNEVVVEKLDFNTIKSYCTKGVGRLAEVAGGRFSDESIDIWMDEEGRLDLEDFHVWAKIRETGEDFCGQILLCCPKEDGDGYTGLTPEQIAIVKKELEWVPGLRGRDPDFQITAWPEGHPLA